MEIKPTKLCGKTQRAKFRYKNRVIRRKPMGTPKGGTKCLYVVTRQRQPNLTSWTLTGIREKINRLSPRK